MQRLQAFKYELMPNGQQERQIHRFAGTCRFIFNKALALQKDRHDQGEKKLSYADLCKLLTAWKQDEHTDRGATEEYEPNVPMLRAYIGG